METRILFTGFGGQGILFAGRLLANAGLAQDKTVTWLPSYGPEMRGGTAYCAVVLSDAPIGSPVVTAPDILVCMNGPSLDKFERALVPGGLLLVDSALVEREAERRDIQAIYIPATRIADERGMKAVANLILAGRLMKERALCPRELMPEILSKITPEHRKDLYSASLDALNTGYDMA